MKLFSFIIVALLATTIFMGMGVHYAVGMIDPSLQHQLEFSYFVAYMLFVSSCILVFYSMIELCFKVFGDK